VICWYVVTCCWINRYQYFGVTYCQYARLLEAAVSSTCTCYQTTFLEEYNLNIHHWENVRYYMCRVNGCLTCTHMLVIHETKFIILVLKVYLSLCMSWRHMESGGIAAPILNLSTTWRWVVTFTLKLFYLWERAPGNHWIGSLAGFRTSLYLLQQKECLVYSGKWTIIPWLSKY